METLYLSCPARAYLENLCSRRRRGGEIARVISCQELEEKLELLLQGAGSESLQLLRDEARQIAAELGLEREYKILDGLIGSLLGTRTLPLTSPIAIARAHGAPYDPKRLDLFQKLYESLASISTLNRPAGHSESALSFFEAYFSNFIEGTEFQVEEALRIIFEGKILKN